MLHILKEAWSGRRSLNYDPQPCSFLSLNSCFFTCCCLPMIFPRHPLFSTCLVHLDVKDCRKGRRLFLLLAPGFLFTEQSEFCVFGGGHLVSRLCPCFIWVSSPLHPYLSQSCHREAPWVGCLFTYLSSTCHLC